MNIYEKILSVMERVREIPKLGKNNFAKYEYVDKDTLYDYMRKFLNDAGLVILSSTVSHERVSFDKEKITRDGPVSETWHESTIEKEIVIVNAENPEERVAIKTRGLSEDKGDKDLYQAETGAMKYFLINNFFISGGDKYPGDVEHENNRVDSGKVKNKRTTKPQNGGGASGANSNGKGDVFSRLYVAEKYCKNDYPEDWQALLKDSGLDPDIPDLKTVANLTEEQAAAMLNAAAEIFRRKKAEQQEQNQREENANVEQ